MYHLARSLRGKGWTPKQTSENKTLWHEHREKALEAHPREVRLEPLQGIAPVGWGVSISEAGLI